MRPSPSLKQSFFDSHIHYVHKIINNGTKYQVLKMLNPMASVWIRSYAFDILWFYGKH